MQKKDESKKLSTENVNNGRRKMLGKLAYTTPTLMTLCLVKEASALGSEVTPPCIPNDDDPNC